MTNARGDAARASRARIEALKPAQYLLAASEVQYVSVTDVLCEGPIYGLIDGGASVFLNNDRSVPLRNSAQLFSQTAAVVTLTQGLTTASISNTTGLSSILTPMAGRKYLIVRNGQLQNEPVQVVPGIQGQHNIIFNPGVFNSSFISSESIDPAQRIIQARLKDSLTKETYTGCFISQGSATSAIWVAGDTTNRTEILLDRFPENKTRFTCSIDAVIGIGQITAPFVFTLYSAWTGASGSYKFDITAPFLPNTYAFWDTEQNVNYEGSRVQFRVGNCVQTPMKGLGGTGAVTISHQPTGLPPLEQAIGYGAAGSGAENRQNDGEVGTAADTVLTGTSTTSGFGLTSAQVQEVDEIKLIFSYPQFFVVRKKNGNNHQTVAAYTCQLKFKDPGSSTFNRATHFAGRRHSYSSAFNQPHFLHVSRTDRPGDVNATTREEVIDLSPFRPFEDFQIVIRRITLHASDTTGYRVRGDTRNERYDSINSMGDHQLVASSTISSVVSTIKEKLISPYTAYAKTSFSSRQFSNLPERSYHCKGLLIKVPSNYVTREESGSGVANYFRDTNGVIQSQYQSWDGSLREDKVYCNNPAWVFYDLITNDRYGLGDFLTSVSTEIDLHALYRIGRYCDEIITTKYNTTEPRYTANIYLVGPMDAYKVIKDFAGVFRSLVVWLNGQITPILDGPRDPMYTFSKANVFEAGFSYESTGARVRNNQVAVTWNNPEQNYEKQTVLVEDKTNISEKNRVLKTELHAFGCTSETQALRYARWSLYTNINQTEVVSFSTGFQGSFLRPGDVIKIQDSDRHSVRLSGRISKSGTVSDTFVSIDSPVDLLSGKQYNLSVIINTPGAFLMDESVSINSISYLKGDHIKEGFYEGNLVQITTETIADNITTASNGTTPVNLSWSPYSHVETKSVVTASGQTSLLEVAEAYSQIPERESVWILTEIASLATVVEGSGKDYQIIGITCDENRSHTISAAEYLPAKFEFVESGFNLHTPDSVLPATLATDIVPPVIDLSYELLTDETTNSELLQLSWIPPNYDKISHFEITHNVLDLPSPIVAKADSTVYKFSSHIETTVTATIRVVNEIDNRSVGVSINSSIVPITADTISRFVRGLSYGGTSNVAFTISSTGLASFASTSWTVVPPGKNSLPISSVSTTASAYQQDCSGVAVITYSASDAVAGFEDKWHYLLLDASDSIDRIKLIKYEISGGDSYWFDTGNGATTAANAFGSNLTGSISLPASSTIVQGTNTLFETEIALNDVIQCADSGGTLKLLTVVSITSDTELRVKNSFSIAVSGSTYRIPNFRPDPEKDTIIAHVYNVV